MPIKIHFFSKIAIYEASSRFGGWIESKKVKVGNDEVVFDKGPRTFRIATGALKELNSIQMVIHIVISKKKVFNSK